MPPPAALPAEEAQPEYRGEVRPEVREEACLGLATLPEPVDRRDLQDASALADDLVEEPDRVVAVAVEDARRVQPVQDGPAAREVPGQVVVDAQAEDDADEDVEGVRGPVAE